MRIGWQTAAKTAGLILLTAGTAAAATAAWGIEPAINSTGDFVANDVGYVAVLAGVGGWASHVFTGHDLGKLTEHGGKMMIAGGVLAKHRQLAAVTGLSAGAVLGHNPFNASVASLIVTNVLILGMLVVGTVGVRRLWAGLCSLVY